MDQNMVNNRVDEDGDVHMRTEEEEQNTIYDWSPTQARMVNYRILENSSDASSGESYFQRTRDGSSYVRRYRPTSSEREGGMTDSDPEDRPARRSSSPEPQEEPVDPVPNRFEDWGYLYTLHPGRSRRSELKGSTRLAFSRSICPKQFLQLLAAKRNPDEPGLQFDYALMYDIYDRNYHKMFRDLVNGEYDQTWDAIVEAWHNRDEERDHLIFTATELEE